MSDEVKKSKKSKQQSEEQTEKKVEEKKEERVPGPRGDVGEASAGMKVRQMWREKHFNRVPAPTKWNPGRRVWDVKGGAPSLKQFARTLAREGNEVAKEWLANKLGAQNESRSDANIKVQRECAMASKAARKKSKAGGGKATTASA